MTPEAVALAERLVGDCGVIGWERLTGTYTTHGALWVFVGTEAGEPVGWFYGGLNSNENVTSIYSTHDRGETVDLDHPSNEGHLRRLAEEVVGRKVWTRWFGTSWAVVGFMRDAAPSVVCLDGKPTPGQAYAAAIVAHYEGERA